MATKEARYEELFQINQATIEAIRQAQRARYNHQHQDKDSEKVRTRR